MNDGTSPGKTFEEGTRQFIPAAEKTDIYSTNRIFRTCAYCRVSTDSEEQMSSFELQNAHYRNLAGKHPNWDLQHVFADEGISGTSLKNRDQFNEMITACRQGKYDLIVTKSVSRFARNLVDCVSIIRELKGLNPEVGVFFETDNLFTLSEESELKLSLLATFAQEESVKKSESMNWSLRERFKNRRLLMPDLLGYTRPRTPGGKYDINAALVINEQEAPIVRFIFDAFLAGYPLCSICDILEDLNIPTQTGKPRWNEGTLRYILSNERYCGNVKTWKTFTADIFKHTKRRNNHDRDQYVYSGMHEGIISAQKFEAAQTLLDNMKHGMNSLSTLHVIEKGIFMGFVPVNHHWVNNDPNPYFEASNSIDTQGKAYPVKKTDLSNFDLSGFQVVRGQFLTRRPERPNLTITGSYMNFNRECTRRFNDVEYIQLLIHPSERKIAIRPCRRHDLHSIHWSTEGKDIMFKRISTPYFSTALYRIMEWNPDYQYHVMGTWVSNGQEQIIMFDVSKAASATYIDYDEEGKRKRVLVCMDDWQTSFGEEFYDFCLQNEFYYIRKTGKWDSQAKVSSLPTTASAQIPSQDELEMRMEELKERRTDDGH